MPQDAGAVIAVVVFVIVVAGVVTAILRREGRSEALERKLRELSTKKEEDQ